VASVRLRRKTSAVDKSGGEVERVLDDIALAAVSGGEVERVLDDIALAAVATFVI